MAAVVRTEGVVVTLLGETGDLAEMEEHTLKLEEGAVETEDVVKGPEEGEVRVVDSSRNWGTTSTRRGGLSRGKSRPLLITQRY